MNGEKAAAGCGAPASTRWNPTKEQISLLECMYNQGLRTPSAQQIEQITGVLRAYGHIEGKNVFYWFQNHKARERQKMKQAESMNLGYLHRYFLHSDVVCGPCYPLESELGFYQRHPTALLHGGGAEIRPQLGAARYEFMQVQHMINENDVAEAEAEAEANDEGSHEYSEVPKTLILFPLEASGLLGATTGNYFSGSSTSLVSTSAEDSGARATSSETTAGSGKISGDPPFFDFFSMDGSRERVGR
ncbi:hypothetical protein NMG60_11014613 [Bertholletia excelsa]